MYYTERYIAWYTLIQKFHLGRTLSFSNKAYLKDNDIFFYIVKTPLQQIHEQEKQYKERQKSIM